MSGHLEIETLDSAAYVRLEPEQTGTKDKFWLQRLDDKRRFLFKMGRNQAENWAEVVCCSIANILGIPCPQYRLVRFEKQNGVLSDSFLAHQEHEIFISGDFALELFDPNYPRELRRPTQYTVERTFALLKLWRDVVELPDGFVRDEKDCIQHIDEIFAGYLLLDALVANQDRHHENWGFIFGDDKQDVFRLAPSFDHASSFSREPDEKKQQRMRDKKFGVEHFCKRAMSPFYNAAGTARLTTYEVFQQVHRILPDAAAYWIARLEQTDVEAAAGALFADADSAMISPVSAEFALCMLRFNRSRLLAT